MRMIHLTSPKAVAKQNSDILSFGEYTGRCVYS